MKNLNGLENFRFEKGELTLWWLLILVIVILILAYFIDFRRKKRRNDKHTNDVDPRRKQGAYGADWNSGDGPNGF